MSSPSPKKFKVQPSAGKVMACVFWDTQGVVLVDFVPPGHTVNADYYCTLLSDHPRPAVRRKRPGLLKTGVILQHDNAPPHRARQTTETVEEMGWELLLHPPYSPDLHTSDFHLFGPLKESLKGVKFENYEDVQQQFLRAADKDLYAAGFSRLVERWERCIELQGDYVEK